VADRLVEGNRGAAFDGESAVLVFDRASPSAVRAGVFNPQTLGLLMQKDAEGSLGQASRRGRGDLLHGGEVETARLRAKASGHDVAPLRSEFADLAQLLLRRFTLGHDPPALRLAPILNDAFP
jgi:hypothetical protein